MIDVEALRADTPGVDRVVHLNNAGAALMPTPVIEAMRNHLDAETLLGGYEAIEGAREISHGIYPSLAALVGSDPSEIALSDSATQAWHRVVYSLRHRVGDRILTTTTEYGSNWAAFLQLGERFGVETVVVGDAPSGEIDLEQLAASIDDRTTLIALNHMPTNGGVVNPAGRVGEIARAAGVPYLLDACQTVGQMPLDVDDIGCDFLTGTSRKFLRGPRGIGFGYVRSSSMGLLDPFVVDNHAARVTDRTIEFRNDARRFETWEKSWINVAGLRAATEYALAVGIDAIWERARNLAAILRRELGVMDGVEVLDRGSVMGAIVTLRVECRPSIEVRELLRERSINVSHATVNSAPVDMRSRGIDDLVRVSPHAYTSDDELDAFLSAMDVIVG
ncbi:MAG: aminotransferase class V-fold PLP-dependent enzyme [Acidimicrobiia bacterium]